MSIRNLKECHVETATFYHSSVEPLQTGTEKSGRKMREYRLRQRKIERLDAPRKIKCAIGDQVRLGQFVRQPFTRYFDFIARAQQRLVEVRAKIVIRIKVSHKLHAAAQTAAADIEKSMPWLQSLRDQKIQLKLPNLVPHPADEAAMFAIGHGGVDRISIVIMGRRWGRMPILRIEQSHRAQIWHLIRVARL